MTTDESDPEMTTDESDPEMTTEETDSDSETPEIIEEATTESIPHDPRDDGMWIPYRRKDGTIVDHYIFGINLQVGMMHEIHVKQWDISSPLWRIMLRSDMSCVVVSMLREQKVGMECDRKPKPHRKMGWIKILIAALFVVVWRGDNCNETVCINGGYSPDNKVCICPTGYLGPHCDAVTTSRPSVSTFAKLLTFNTVIYNAFSDYWGRAGFAKFKESVNNHLEKFNYTQYNIAVFTEDNPNGFKTTNTSSSKEEFLATLHSQNPIYPESYGCTNQPFYTLMCVKSSLLALKLRDTALTVVTQFPPISDDTARDELQRLASAFNVRINVIWISDEIYVRCLFDNVNKQYDEFSHIAFNTGGLFVPQMYDKDDKPLLTDVVIASHYQYQSVGFGAFGDCSSVRRSFSWQADPQPIPTYLVVEGADVSMRGCPMMELPNKLSSGQRIFNVTTSRQRCTLILSNKSGHCSAKVFLSDVSNTGVRLYSSFVEDPVIDSSSYRPTTSNKFYITMRAEVNSDTYSIQPFTSTVYSSEGQPKEIVIVNRTDVATFTFVTDDSFVCNATGGCQWWWAEVRFSVIQKGNDTVQYMQRSIPFRCYTDNSADGTTIGSTLSTKSSTTIFTTVGSTSSTIMDSTVTTTGSATSSTITSSGGGDTTSSTSKTTVTTRKGQDNPSTFAYGFANTLPEYYYETFFVASLNNVTSLFGNYGMIRFEVSNASAVVYHPEDTLADFTNDVYNTYAWGKISSSLQYVDSQVLEALLKVTSSENLYENSLVSFCVDKLPTAAQFTTQNGTVPYSSLVNKNVKALFFLDRKTLDREIGYQRTSGPLSEIAASTNGHLIISDQNDQTDFLALLQMLYTQGPSQSLLFARSVNPSQKLTSLGTIDIGQPINVTITVTTSVYSICQEKNTPDEADTRYRTYTVIIGVDKYGIESLLLDDAAIFARPKQEPTTIWRYQLILYCSNGNVLPLYIGGNFTDFNAAMSSRTGFCSQVKDDEFNLANIYRAAVTGLGRFVRGMIIFYNEAPYLMNVDLEEFIAISKVYRQELFIYAVDPEYPGHSVVYKNFNDVRDAAYITGGNILFGDFNDDWEPQPMNAYTEMLSSDVSLTVHANRQTGRVSAFIDSGATGYVFVSNQDQSLIGVRNATGPSIVFTMSNGWKVQNNADKNYRVASRQSCTFGYDTFTVFSSMKNAVNFITVTLTNGTSALQRALPIPSTSAVDCQNGGYEKVDRCSCPIGFSAPDCSRPVCQTGTLNTWGDVCNSDLWPYGGRFCQG
ncbi:hypothetical protein NECAME_15645 [Necator americanus]|uniref:EGF-like domain-containing protein n=1 Tax=Necator americanus TaxID=51031 RepID=W2SIV4_NECAM|nr:hypothetical protein NECAME_15645 [Necator americanus]ETN68771.1 hypothetical protein NECAME_15645 [Necator americanus]